MYESGLEYGNHRTTVCIDHYTKNVYNGIPKTIFSFTDCYTVFGSSKFLKVCIYQTLHVRTTDMTSIYFVKTDDLKPILVYFNEVMKSKSWFTHVRNRICLLT